MAERSKACDSSESLPAKRGFLIWVSRRGFKSHSRQAFCFPRILRSSRRTLEHGRVLLDSAIALASTLQLATTRPTFHRLRSRKHGAQTCTNRATLCLDAPVTRTRRTGWGYRSCPSPWGLRQVLASLARASERGRQNAVN
ncbi:hypothetical protein GY45DRAFT_967058 [Cubamyces sp. BRFM 1775]|nr:hypothetical protein GY45DRAFT_967058 [Cubamyces sp. BRFM 1775]